MSDNETDETERMLKYGRALNALDELCKVVAAQETNEASGAVVLLDLSPRIQELRQELKAFIRTACGFDETKS